MIAIFGTGGMGRELYDIALAAGLNPAFFVTDQPDGPVLGVTTLYPHALEPALPVALAVGSSEARRKLAERFAGRTFPTICSVTSVVSPSARIGEGGVICDYAVINNSAVIGRHFQCNTFAQVSHDCIIGDFVTFSPRVTCNGWVEIGDDVFVGAGAVIRNGSPEKRLKIGKGAIIGMGAVVTKDVPEGATVMGCPARPDQ